jgi:hypothetical protein
MVTGSLGASVAGAVVGASVAGESLAGAWVAVPLEQAAARMAVADASASQRTLLSTMELLLCPT